MPEGDTIWKTAATLRRAIAGRRVAAFTTAVPLSRRPEPGTSIQDVEARGKHLLIRFGDGSVLHTHLRMSGSWHLYRTGEPWRRPRRSMRVAIDTGRTQAVCFGAPVVELLRASELDRHPAIGRLGPDLTAPAPDLDEALRRLSRLAPEQIGVVLLDQRVAAGVGNVYKSEVLFSCGVHPFAVVGELDGSTLAGLLATAARLLRANAERPGPRTTTRTGGLAVYRRRGQPCPRCGARIQAARQGDQARVTYWCPRCQPARPQDAGTS